MPIYPQQNNFQPQNPAPLDYDLQSEKKRIAEATEEIKKEFLEKWQKRYAGTQIFPDKLASASREMINFLLSFQNTLFYNSLAKKFTLDQNQRDVLPQIIWKICLGKNWDSLALEIQSGLKTNSSVAGMIASEINQNILNEAKELSAGSPSAPKIYSEKPAGPRLEKMTVAEALKAYPEMAEQAITTERIESKTQHGQVRPTLGNWLADYRFVMGFGHHDGIGRSNYLFQSINGRKLTSPERQKLAYLFKALDENEQVTVNKDLKQLVFPTPTAGAEQRPASSVFSSQPQHIKPETAPEPQATGASMQNIRRFFQGPGAASPSSRDLHRQNIPSPTIPGHLMSSGQDDRKTSNVLTGNGPAESNIKFSSPQKLPYEKATTEVPAKPAPAIAPTPSAPINRPRPIPTFRYNPVSGVISDKQSSGLQNRENHIDTGNIVNLRKTNN